MRLSRPSRFVAALFVLCSVLFTQLAVAGYACQSMQIAQAMELMAPASPMLEHHDMPGCEMDLASSSLCHDQRPSGKQSMDKPEIPHVSPFVAAMLVQAIWHSDLSPPSVTAPAGGSFLTRATAPALAIQNCRFQI